MTDSELLERRRERIKSAIAGISDVAYESCRGGISVTFAECEASDGNGVHGGSRADTPDSIDVLLEPIGKCVGCANFEIMCTVGLPYRVRRDAEAIECSPSPIAASDPFGAYTLSARF